MDKVISGINFVFMDIVLTGDLKRTQNEPITKIWLYNMLYRQDCLLLVSFGFK